MTEPKASIAITPFGLPVFRALWIATLVSNLGSLIQSVGASWMMASLTDSPQLVALVQAATTLPVVLLSLIAGAVADNMDRKLILLWSQVAMLVFSLMLSVCAWAGLLNPGILLAFTFLIACGSAFYNPAWQASVGDIVPRALVPGAVALNSMNYNIARTVGPAIGGVVVAVAGAASAFLLNTVSYLGIVAVLVRWRPHREPNPLPRETLGKAVAAGLRYAAFSSHINVVLLRAAIFASAASAVPALMPVVARDLMAGGPLVFGTLLSAFGIGAVVGALSSNALRQHFSPEGISRIGGVAVAIGALVTGGTGSLMAATPALLIAGAGWVLAISTFNVSVQLASPRWVVARAIALYQVALFGGMTLGSWGFGLIADQHGIAAALILAGCWQIIGVLIGIRIRLPRVEHLDLNPLDTWTAPEVDVEPRSGPVVVLIEYRIDQIDQVAFLTAMNERRRIRRRDGARHWSLLRSLSDPALWTERYDFPTWLDYVRHNKRRTEADSDNSRRLRELHKGPGAPGVQRWIERQTHAVRDATMIDPSV